QAFRSGHEAVVHRRKAAVLPRTRKVSRMLASASGPLGALLMIAPLAAIPVFAIIGVPQFAPVSASSADDEEVVDLGEPAQRHAPPPAARHSPKRSADDLYAPVRGDAARSQPGNRNDFARDSTSQPTLTRDRTAERLRGTRPAPQASDEA